MKTADSFYSKYEFPLRRDRSSGVYTKDDLLDFAEAFATKHDQEIKDMVDEMIEAEKVRLKANPNWLISLTSKIVALKELRSKL